MLLLAAIVTLGAVWFTGDDRRNRRRFLRLPALLIAGGAIGAFASLDLFFFYAFHELALIPTFLLIGIWGTGNRIRRRLENHDLSRDSAASFCSLGLIMLYRSVPRGVAQFRSPRAAKAPPIGGISAGAQNQSICFC